ncbi:hypothetical protein KGY64_05750, partial [Candidatus Bipolaricaulota bacterium]|nr:hypothetical protein [Candidatus Bipolaricaulota bacterium]
GCTHYGADGRSAFSAFSVQPVDTTAAGDAFAGGLAVALGEGKTIEESIPFASAAGAISTTREGAQPSLPGRDEVLEFLKGETNYEVSTTFFTGETDEQRKQKQDL